MILNHEHSDNSVSVLLQFFITDCFKCFQEVRHNLLVTAQLTFIKFDSFALQKLLVHRLNLSHVPYLLAAGVAEVHLNVHGLLEEHKVADSQIRRQKYKTLVDDGWQKSADDVAAHLGHCRLLW